MLNIFVGFEQANKYVICQCLILHFFLPANDDQLSERRRRGTRIYR